ncbi:MAG: alanine racemase [Bacteroidales bacterium]|nr:alanine racemase [Bacteroidales bacterium]
MNINTIKHPTLLIDKEKVIRNIAFMTDKAKKHKLILRPHFKTHQSAEIGNWFRDFGIEQITVSSVSMAQYFTKNAWKDITIAFPLNIRELEDISELAKQVKLNVLISSEATAKYFSENINNSVSYFIKIDAGYGRAGVKAENFTEITKIVQICSRNKNIGFKGFLAHFGNTYHAKNKEEVLKIYQMSKKRLISLKSHFVKDFPNLILSIGDTPSSTLSTDFKGIDEIRPGNFVFYDLMQHFIGACTLDKIAVALACPVTDIYPERSELLIYGGAVHLSKEYILDKQGNKIFGQIVTLNKNSWQITDKPMYISNISQEHGIVSVHHDFLKSVKTGDLIGVLPVHSCLTADLMRQNGGFLIV